MNLTKLVLCIFLFLSNSLNLWAQVSESQEQEVQIQSNKALAHSVSKVMHEKFLSSIVAYNKDRDRLSVILANHKRSELAQRVQDFVVPAFKLQKNHHALAAIGPHQLKLSTQDISQGLILINGEVFDLKQELSVEIVREHLLKTRTTTTSILDLILSRAHAQERDAFEIAVFATLINIQDSFNDEWCLRSQCSEEKGKENLDKIMKSMNDYAQACKRNPHQSDVKDLGSKIVDYLQYGKDGLAQHDFELALEEYFNEHDSGEATCQDFVNTFYSDEIEKRAGRGEVMGYLGGLRTSAEAVENKTKNKEAYDKYIKETCRPYVELRNCLVQKRYSQLRRVYDNTRESGKLVPPAQDYDVKPRRNEATGR